MGLEVRFTRWRWTVVVGDRSLGLRGWVQGGQLTWSLRDDAPICWWWPAIFNREASSPVVSIGRPFGTALGYQGTHL